MLYYAHATQANGGDSGYYNHYWVMSWSFIGMESTIPPSNYNGVKLTILYEIEKSTDNHVAPTFSYTKYDYTISRGESGENWSEQGEPYCSWSQTEATIVGLSSLQYSYSCDKIDFYCRFENFNTISLVKYEPPIIDFGWNTRNGAIAGSFWFTQPEAIK